MGENGKGGWTGWVGGGGMDGWMDGWIENQYLFCESTEVGSCLSALGALSK